MATSLRPLVGSALVALATPAGAQRAVEAGSGKGKTATLGWARLPGAESCIGTQELAKAVDQLLGRQAFVSASSAELAIEGRVEKKDGALGFRAVISVSNATGESLGTRELEVEGVCSDLNEPVALALALMIDPDAELGAPKKEDPPRTDPPPKEPPRTVYVPVKVPVPVPAPPPEPVWRGDVLAGFALGFGWLPGVNPGAIGAASLTPPKFVPLEVSVSFFAPRSEEILDRASVMFYSLQGAGFLCPFDHMGALGGVRACAGVTGGFIVADGDGFDYEDPDESGVYGTVGATLRGRGTIRVYKLLHLGIAAEMTVPFVRPEFVYVEPGGLNARVFQPAPVLGTLHAFSMLSFP